MLDVLRNDGLFFGDFLLTFREPGPMGLCGHLLQGAERTSSNANFTTVEGDRLKVDVLTSFGGDVGVATRLTEVGAFSGKKTDAGHKKINNVT